MSGTDVFVSVGGTSNEKQESFVRAIEDRLRAEGLNPRTVGRNTFSADSPLKTVERLMNQCSGTVVIALERIYLQKGVEKRGGEREKQLADVTLPTPWNQIEAAMSYSRGLPLLVIVEKGIKAEGLLERGYDWYVQEVEVNTAALNTTEFNGVLASWQSKVSEAERNKTDKPDDIDPTSMTIGQIIGSLKPTHLWSMLIAAATVIGGAFALGAKLFIP
jgi:hypothetical protein